MNRKQLGTEPDRDIGYILNVLFHQSPDAMVALDRHGNLLMVNEAIEHLIGVPIEEFSSGRQKILDYYPPGLAREILRILKSNAYGPPGVIVDYEAHVLNAQGEKVPVSFSGTLIKKNGKIRMTIGIVRDIRERKALEQQLINSKQLLDLIFNTMSDGIRVIDESLTIQYENLKMKELLGEGLGKKCFQTHLRGLEGRVKPCPDCPVFPVQKGQAISREISDEKGKTYLISSNVLDMEGEPPSILQVIKDITLRKEKERIEKEKSKLDAVMELAGAAAHELNQPLTTIIMGLELITRQHRLQRPIPPEVIKDVLQGAERMSDIIKKLSDITKYETRNYLETLRILDLNESSDS